ncbi:MAG: YdcF family protein [Myxococcales bacterium]|nr:YdcF family protein [Myxococcales bacterium]MCB9644481.1 YdcF family protein [Myxococcales bacterium]
MTPRTLLLLTLPPSIVFLGVLFCHQWIHWRHTARLHTDANKLPKRRYGLVLGTRKMLRHGRPNLYFQYRIDAALRLWRAGKVEAFILSGANDKRLYETEIDDMQAALIAGGVPAKALLRDPLGTRTWLSILSYHAKFAKVPVILISQRFHNARALFLARSLGLDAIAFNAEAVPFSVDIRTPVREIFSRIRAFYDVFFSSRQL